MAQMIACVAGRVKNDSFQHRQVPQDPAALTGQAGSIACGQRASQFHHA